MGGTQGVRDLSGNDEGEEYGAPQERKRKVERPPGDVCHQLTRRAPGVVVGGFPHLGLHLRVVHHHIGPEQKRKAPWFTCHL